MSQNFSLKKGTSHRIGLFTPENGFNLMKMSFYFQNRSSRPKIDPRVNFSNFQAEEIFSFPIFLRHLDDERAEATPWLINFAKIRSEHVLKIKVKSHKSGHPRLRRDL